MIVATPRIEAKMLKPLLRLREAMLIAMPMISASTIAAAIIAAAFARLKRSEGTRIIAGGI